MRSLATVCFFLSGASSLIFQVIWTRLFSLVFGTTTLAISTVLTAFMAGLALGSYLAGRLADRLGNPLRSYALMEAGIGLYALALPAIVSHFDTINSWAHHQFGHEYLPLALTRFVVSAAAIVVPTTLMGATLPLLARYFVRDDYEHSGVGSRVGALYAVNTAGAVVGTLVGGFAALPSLGLALSNTVAACVNLLLALLVAFAFLLQRRRRRSEPAGEPAVLRRELAQLERALPPEPLPFQPPRTQRWVLAAFAISGATAMIYEVIWSRALGMVIGSSVYSFTIVLGAFLIGLAGGAALLSRLASRSERPLLWLSTLHILIASAIALSYLLLDDLPRIYLLIMAGESLRVGGILKAQLILALLLMLPATLAMGGIFPLTIRVVSTGLPRVGRDVGRAYAINTIGAIGGSFLGGFVVVPLLQLQPGLRLTAAINCALALILALVSQSRQRHKVTLVALALAIAAGYWALPQWNLYDLSVGPFRPSVAQDVIRGIDPGADLVFYRDGVSTTVTVEKWSEKHFSLKNNGKVDASTGDDMPTQITVGLLPLLLHPETPELAPEVALIGLASGVTAGAILRYPVKRLDVVELEPAIAAASHFFDHVNHRPLEDERLELIADDGRNFLTASSRRYDVIINEPSNPWITGVSNLFTREYFHIARQRLRPRGIFCSWAQIYELSPRRIKSIYRAFADAFPHAYAFSASTLSTDTLLIGSEQPLKLDIQRLRRAAAPREVQRELERADIERPDDLIALTLLGPGEIDAFGVGATANTDDNALVEFAAPRDLYQHGRFDYYLSKVYGNSWAYGRLDQFISGYVTSDDYAGLVHSLLRQGRLREAEAFSAQVDSAAGPSSRRVAALLSQVLPPADATPDSPPLETDGPLAPPKPPAGAVPQEIRARIAETYPEILRRHQFGDPCAAVELIEKWPEDAAEASGVDFNLLWGVLNYECGNLLRAANILRPLLDAPGARERRPVLLYYAGHALYAEGEYARGLETLDAWLRHVDPGPKPTEPRPER
jgi:spermidine synthase